MRPFAYADAFHLLPADEPLRAGDLVCTGPNLFPHFEVVALDGDKAWVRNVQTGEDVVALAARCRRIARTPAAG